MFVTLAFRLGVGFVFFFEGERDDEWIDQERFGGEGSIKYEQVDSVYYSQVLRLMMPYKKE